MVAFPPVSKSRFSRSVLLGARSASSFERAGFGSLGAFALTVGIARGVNYARERQRNFPRLRSLGRQAARVRRPSGIRVHHFIPGIGIAFAAGGVAISGHSRPFWISLPYGTGVALTLDELALLLKHDKAYWSSERVAVVQGLVAAGGAAALAARFHRRGLAASAG